MKTKITASTWTFGAKELQIKAEVVFDKTSHQNNNI